jgi:indolepyruvate ferredoxin oxidoreductase alpha subunit
MGYGLGGAGRRPHAGRQARHLGDGRRRFWHNGLTSGIANAVFNQSNNLTIVVDNSYTSATGGQDILSSTAQNATAAPATLSSRRCGRGREMGENGASHLRPENHDRYSAATLTSKTPGPKVLIAQSECMLNRQRREKQQVRKALESGKRVVAERFGVDSDTCTGDHSAFVFRLSVAVD